MKIPQIAFPHLISAAEQEIARLEAIHEAVGDDWPDEFDANDITHIQIVLEDLQDAAQSGGEIQTADTKSFSFFRVALVTYFRANRQGFSPEEYAALETVYGSSPVYGRNLAEAAVTIMIPHEAMTHLMKAVEKEIARLKAIEARESEHWWVNCDLNDIGCLEIIRESLQSAIDQGRRALRFRGMVGRLLLWCIPDYLRDSRASLTAREYQVVKDVYDLDPLRGPLPQG